MVLGQALKTTGRGETLRQHDADGDCYLILLGGRPSVNVLQKGREGGLFETFLKKLLSEGTDSDGISYTNQRSRTVPSSPSD